MFNKIVDSIIHPLEKQIGLLTAIRKNIFRHSFAEHLDGKP